MANTRSARKRIRANERKHVRNRAVKSAVRTQVTKARRTLLSPVEGVDVADAVRAAVSALDRAAEKGILHPNNARRRKSRLATMAASLQRAGQESEGAAVAARSTAAGGAKGRSAKQQAGGAKRAKAAAKTPTKSPAKAQSGSRPTRTAKGSTAKR